MKIFAEHDFWMQAFLETSRLLQYMDCHLSESKQSWKLVEMLEEECTKVT